MNIKSINLKRGNIVKSKNDGIVTVDKITDHLISSKEFGEWINLSEIEYLGINETRLKGFADFSFSHTYRSLIVTELTNNRITDKLFLGFSDETQIVYIIMSNDLTNEENTKIIGFPHIKYIHELQQIIELFKEPK